MKPLRAFAILFALVVIGGELLRSWGERDPIFWIDDFMVGVSLIATALLLGRRTAARRALFTGAWGFSVGVIYISFFDKVIGAALIGPGVEFNRLNIFVTFTLACAIAGFVGSLLPPFDQAS